MNKELIERIADRREQNANWGDEVNEEIHQLYVRMAEWFVDAVADELFEGWNGDSHPSDWLRNDVNKK